VLSRIWVLFKKSDFYYPILFTYQSFVTAINLKVWNLVSATAYLAHYKLGTCGHAWV